MSWRDELRPASFRGVPFFISTQARSGGRRGVVHEFPGRDLPFVEDLGRKARTFPVEGYVLGKDYLAARDLLITALEAEGPGELILPLAKPQQVAVLSEFRVQESLDSEGGVARFSITFTETQPKPQPTATPDAAGALASSAGAARTAIGSTFLGQYAPGPLLSSVAAALQSVTLTVRKAMAPVALAGQSRASLDRLLTAFEADVSSLVAAPEQLLADLSTLFDSVPDAAALQKVYAFSPGVRPPATTVNRIQERANFDATQRLVQRLALVRMVEVTAGAVYTSFEEAVAARAAVADLLDEQAEVTTDDAYPALLQLRADLVRAVPASGATLPHLLPHTPVATLPSLVLAHQLYGDVALEQDLIARNGVRNPGFIPGGRALEVLSRG